MQGDKDHIIHFTAEDFERYHSGKMNVAEMHSLEKAALDDPFIADALEGYVHTSTASQDIKEISSRLGEKEKQGRVVMFSKGRLADILKIASVMLLLGGFGWIIYQQRSVKNKDFAKVEKKQTSPGVDSQSVPAPEEQSTAPSSVVIKPVPEKNGEQKNKLPQRYEPENNIAVTEDKPIAEEERSIARDNTSLPTLSDHRKDDNITSKETVFNKVPAIHTIKGKVTDNTGMPVPFAVIKDQNNNVSLSADDKGSFLLKSNDSTALVAVDATGYETKKMYINSDKASNNIVLTQSNNNLAEVTVTAAGKRKAEAYDVAAKPAADGILLKNAEPLNGPENLNQHATNQNRLFAIRQQKNIHGTVKVSFDVDSLGNAINLKIEKPLDSVRNAEAIRIVEEGTRWKQNKKTAKAEATIQF